MSSEQYAAYNVYAQQLFPRKHGYPLWHPEPSNSEIRIGDVGYLSQGAFTRIFNATLPGSDPSHEEYGVPDNHEPFAIFRFLRQDHKAVISSHLCSTSVRSFQLSGELATSVTPVGAGLKFQCSQEQGAFVFVDLPADRSQMGPSKSLAHYLRTNIEKWLDFVSTKHDLDIKLEDLLFVSGVVKAHDWGLGAFTSNGLSGEVYFQAPLGPFIQGSFDLQMQRGTTGDAEWRAKPHSELELDRPKLPLITLEQEYSDASSSAGPSSSGHSLAQIRPSKDQCLFLHFYKVKKRIWRFKQVIKAAAGPDERDFDPSGDGEDVSGMHEEYDVEEMPPIEKAYNPVDYLLDYILDYPMEDGSQVDIAVASDTHIYSLFDDEVPLDVKAALEKLRPPVMFLDDDREMAGLAIAEWSEEFDNVAQDLDGDAEKQWDGFSAQDRLQEGTERDPDAPMDADGEIKDDAPAHLAVVLQEHTGGVTCIAVSSDGQYIASGSEDTSIHLRDGTTGAVIARLTNPDLNEIIYTLDFSPQCDRLASGGGNGLAVIWDLATRSVTAVLDGHEGVVQTIAYSPDGTKVVTSSIDFNVRIWDAATGGLLHVLEGHKAVVMAALFSPDGRWVGSCSADYTAKIWDAHAGTLHRSLEAHQGVVWSLAFDWESRRVVTGSDDMTSIVWNADTGEALVLMHEHTGPVWSAAFAPDGKVVMSASNDATLKLCDAYTGDLRHTLERHDTLVNAAVFSPDGKYVASSAGDNAVMVWSTKTGSNLPAFGGHSDKITGLHFLPGGNRLVSASDDGSVRIWTLPDAVPEPVS